MKKLYKINTNASMEMISVDYDNRIARIYGGTDGWQYDHSLVEVEDDSSWGEGDFDDIVADLESNDPDFQIVEEREFDD